MTYNLDIKWYWFKTYYNSYKIGVIGDYIIESEEISIKNKNLDYVVYYYKNLGLFESLTEIEEKMRDPYYTEQDICQECGALIKAGDVICSECGSIYNPDAGK